MSLLKLKIVELIDRYKQVTAVADALRMKQPTISFHMKNMESEWGIKLFEARAGRMVLTDAGKSLLPYATRIGALYEEAETVIGELRDNERALLRIGCTDCAQAAMARMGWLARVGSFPGSRIAVVTADEDTLYRRLEFGELDLVLGGRRSADPERLPSIELLVSPFMLLFPANHPLTGAADHALAERLQRYPFVVHAERSLSELVAPWLARHGVASVAGTFDSAQWIVQAVEAGLGLAILPQCMLPEDARKTASANVPGRPENWTLYAVRNAREGNAELAERAIQALLDL
ncbi:LysR family transcriptional regulator [Cohnella sp.]|uniref:LysR family transcriptional regulator n=1 Tax=Cohnella sp. TaxID=1883426 RepID=UPI003704AE38